MHMNELIIKKRNGLAHTPEELQYIVDAYVKGNIPDYQMSAWLMAVYYEGMSAQETAQFTKYMAESGEQIDLSVIPGITVDKHSTGGVGDKTTFIITSIVAACGVPVAKMSGRGLGHTGGTIDKLESIPHVNVALNRDEFLSIVKSVGVAVTGQSENLAPADKLLYALRDVTGTVDSIPLIASSVMSKKLASGSQGILLDVKVGSGAFMKSLDDAIALAQVMVSIGEENGRHMMALITDMDRPLGQAVGNALEIEEVVQTLHGLGPKDLTEESLVLAAYMLYLGGKGPLDICRKLAEDTLYGGKAYEKFVQMVEAQGGDSSVLKQPEFGRAPFEQAVIAPQSGYITHMDAEACGRAALALGAGRHKKGDPIDYKAGLRILKKTGDFVELGEVIAYVQSSTKELLSMGAEAYVDALQFGDTAPAGHPLILASVSTSGVERYAPSVSIADEAGKHQMPGLADGIKQTLIQAARTAQTYSYSPYSKFRVGAALLCEDGSIVTGCNIENASYGLTNCAERVAIQTAVAMGQKQFKAIAIVGDSEGCCMPCGACRQVLVEFRIPYIIMADQQNKIHTFTLEQLIPHSFGPDDL